MSCMSDKVMTVLHLSLLVCYRLIVIISHYDFVLTLEHMSSLGLHILVYYSLSLITSFTIYNEE